MTITKSQFGTTELIQHRTGYTLRVTLTGHRVYFTYKSKSVAKLTGAATAFHATGHAALVKLLGR